MADTPPIEVAINLSIAISLPDDPLIANINTVVIVKKVDKIAYLWLANT